MEIIGYGILLALGFYLAPIVLTVVAGAVIVVFSIISSIFGGRR